jgi:hypothetical protein
VEYNWGVINLNSEDEEGFLHCAGVLCLDNAFALIEGHPAFADPAPYFPPSSRLSSDCRPCGSFQGIARSEPY